MGRMSKIMNFLIKHDDNVIQPIGKFAENLVEKLAPVAITKFVKPTPLGPGSREAVRDALLGPMINTAIHKGAESAAQLVVEQPPISDATPAFAEPPKILIESPEIQAIDPTVCEVPLVLETFDHFNAVDEHPWILETEVENIGSPDEQTEMILASVPNNLNDRSFDANFGDNPAVVFPDNLLTELGEILVSTPTDSAIDMANWKDPRIRDLNLSEEQKQAFQQAFKENLAQGGDFVSLTRRWEEKIEQQENDTANDNETLQQHFNEFVNGSNRQSDLEQIRAQLDPDLIESTDNPGSTDIQLNDPLIEQIQLLQEQGLIGTIDNPENTEFQVTDPLVEQFRSLQEQGLIGDTVNSGNNELQVNGAPLINGMLNPDNPAPYDGNENYTDIEMAAIEAYEIASNQGDINNQIDSMEHPLTLPSDSNNLNSPVFDDYINDSSIDLDPVEEYALSLGIDSDLLNYDAKTNDRNSERNDHDSDDDMLMANR